MKDKRNCPNNLSYPVYNQPMMVPPMGYPAMYPNNFQGQMMNGVSNIDQQLNNIEQQLNLLDQRVTRLENLGSNNTTNYTKYNDSKYYMV